MEDVGTQVAAPIFIHPTLSPVARKRDLYYQTSNLQAYPPPHLPQREDWNPNLWDWDSVRFVAKPLDAENLRLGNDSTNSRRLEISGKTSSSASRNKAVDIGGDDRLELNLGGGLNAVEDPPVSRPSKRVRSGSPGGGNYPMCQVDNCKEDLSKAKDYHRRHKVCELHSKATQALVGKQMQRFCQQCSRFHLLSEFDEGKRSCRRRLAGHNRRRRKTQPEDVASRLVVPGSQDNAINGNLNLVTLLTALACAQGNSDAKRVDSPAAPDRDQLLQILNKINSLPLPMDLAAKLQTFESLNRKNPAHPQSNHQNEINGTSPLTMDLLAVLSSTLASSSHDALAIFSQKSGQKADSEKTKIASSGQGTAPDVQKTRLEFPSVGGEGSSSSHQSPSDDSDCQVLDTRSNLSLQLFTSSPEDESRPKLTPSRKYFSSDSSNPIEDRSPSSSPVVQKLFPMHSNDNIRSWNVSRRKEANKVESTRTACVPLELFNGSNRGGADGAAVQSFPHHSGYTSSGSDHSPSSLNSDNQDRTGRIIFKLFDKDPSHFPGSLRSQIYNWLSNIPTEMESYIRPGCVLLSVYVSMSSTAWMQLEGNLLQRVNCLVQDSDSDFWRNTRFLINTGKQLASHKNGKIRLCKSWMSWNAPELICVSPLAVVAGQETTLSIHGRNLTHDGTKVHCAYMGSYSSIEIKGAISHGNTYDEINLRRFQIQGTSAGAMGRCFIEVENGFRGNAFPLIIADAKICNELKHLEREIRKPSKIGDVIIEERTHDCQTPSSREEVLHFLNELGWLFQRKKSSCISEESKYCIDRFKFLLVFSVERDCNILVKTLLDMLVERNPNTNGLCKETLDMLTEIQLLNRAVKRRCRQMVEMLVHYSISDTTSKKYVFPPNLSGPGDITPLHLAACTSGSEDVIDALTDDPQEIGLSCWDTLLDAAGQSPHSYAEMRNNHSYNNLVARKVTDRKNGQVSLMIVDESVQTGMRKLGLQIKKTCATCANVALKYNKRIPCSQGLFPGPLIHSMVAVATVCVCVCLFMRAFPDVGKVAPFKWERLDYGTM